MGRAAGMSSRVCVGLLYTAQGGLCQDFGTRTSVFKWECSIFLLYSDTADPSRQLYFIIQMKSKWMLAALKIHG